MITIVADCVAKMTRLEESGPYEAQDTTQKIGTKYVKGIAYEDDQVILILDFERLLHAS